MVMRKVGKYEVGRTIDEGTFAKVKFAKNTETGEGVAMKVLAKSSILKHEMVDQVLASQTKIYIILEFVTGGELFDKIVHQGRFSERESRYLQQLIDDVVYCHKKGVYHRDLKPENLLLDSQGNLKISDFGLSALRRQGVELLHTTCGTPNHVAPEMRVEGVSANKAGQFAIALEVFEVAPDLLWWMFKRLLVIRLNIKSSTSNSAASWNISYGACQALSSKSESLSRAPSC